MDKNTYSSIFNFKNSYVNVDAGGSSDKQENSFLNHIKKIKNKKCCTPDLTHCSSSGDLGAGFFRPENKQDGHGCSVGQISGLGDCDAGVKADTDVDVKAGTDVDVKPDTDVEVDAWVDDYKPKDGSVFTESMPIQNESDSFGSVSETISQSVDRQIRFQSFLVNQQQRQAEYSAFNDTQTASIRSSKEGANGISERSVDDASDNNSIQTS